MYTYRAFRNTDPPAVTAVWRSRAGQGGLMGAVSPDLFEQLIFAKLYFEYAGLILARDGQRTVGFGHAAFGPNEDGSAISTELGVSCLVLACPGDAEIDVAAGLLEQCEQYLRRRGAKVLYGGGIRPLNPFYLGLYGGSELPGVLDTDVVAQQLYRSHGYQEIDRTVALHCDLSTFQSPIDRGQMQIRRQMVVEVTVDAPTQTWWDACTLGDFELTRFDLVSRSGGAVVASALFRSMEPTGTAGIGRAAGLIDLAVDEALRRRGVATFLLSEAFRQFTRQGIVLVAAQTMEHNVGALGVYRKLGFQPVGHGSVFRKQG